MKSPAFECSRRIWGLSLGLLASGTLALSSDFQFPEESQRSIWDEGCVDFSDTPFGNRPLAQNSLTQVSLKRGDKSFRVWARMRVPPEAGESVDGVFASVSRILGNASNYAQWVLPGINEPPEGGRYFVSVEGLTSRLREGNLQPPIFQLTGPFTFQLLWFQRKGFATLEFKESTYPKSCPEWNSLKSQSYLYRMTPRPDLLEALLAEVIVLQKKDDVELRLRLYARPSRWVFEILPEKLLSNQLAPRGQRIFDNFTDFRRLEALASLRDRDLRGASLLENKVRKAPTNLPRTSGAPVSEKKP